MNFISRPKAIILGFLKGFFEQDKLFTHIPNEFQYIDNKKQNSLLIKVSETVDQETVNGFPAIIFQEGGFSEDKSTIDHKNWTDLRYGSEGHIGSFYHPVTLHCIAANKGSAETLQAVVAKSIISFRKAIYIMGVDNISPLQGSPAQRITQSDQTVQTLYDCVINFNMKMEQSWILDYKGGDVEENVRFTITAALNEIEFDENCNPINDPDEWFQQNISLG